MLFRSATYLSASLHSMSRIIEDATANGSLMTGKSSVVDGRKFKCQMLHTMAMPDVQPSRRSTNPLLAHSVDIIRNQPEEEWSTIDEALSRALCIQERRARNLALRQCKGPCCRSFLLTGFTCKQKHCRANNAFPYLALGQASQAARICRVDKVRGVSKPRIALNLDQTAQKLES